MVNLCRRRALGPVRRGHSRRSSCPELPPGPSATGECIVLEEGICGRVLIIAGFWQAPMAVGNGPEGGGLVGEAAAFGADADEEEDEDEDEEEESKKKKKKKKAKGEMKPKPKGKGKKGKGKSGKKASSAKKGTIKRGGKKVQGAGRKPVAPPRDNTQVTSGTSGGGGGSMTGGEPGFQQLDYMDTTEPKVKVLEDLSWLSTGVPIGLEEDVLF